MDFNGTNILTGSLDIISQSLTIPVLIILLIIVAVTIILLGQVVREYFKNKTVKVGEIRDLMYGIDEADNITEVRNLISSSNLPSTQKNILLEICNADSMKKATREALARKLVEWEEEKIDKKLNRTDVITRIGPTLGLMGTLIPMGPGLAALGAGDINTLASSLTVAFNTTIVGIGSGALCYVLGKIRNQWAERYLSDLDALTDAVLDFMG
ncbi:MotA/TolQ/ExbB proton channel family protein [Methanobrevibacter thaueri]|uniref:MotA/TolQ/ExbB proton channel family protein n=1 Tax=Methanobrevibacter thaueri TaxID=190975 RepID=UPI00386D4F9A